jgi:large subunit ribosomal protein L9
VIERSDEVEVILLKDVENIGAKGDIANVADGYARNYLFPRSLAQTATPGRVAAIRKAMEEKATRERREAERAEEVRDTLSKTVLTIPASVGAGERLFGSITNQDVATAIFNARKIRIDKRNVVLEEPIRSLGTYLVRVDVHESVEPAEVKVIVAAEGAEE